MAVPSAGLRFAHAVNRETPVSTFVPYTRHVDPHTLATRSGHLLQVIALDGIPYETFDQADLNHLKGVRNTIFRVLADPRFALYHTCIRREIPSPTPESFSDPFCDALERSWTERLSGCRSFAVEHYLTVVRRELPGALGALEWLGGLFSKRDEALRQQAELAALKALREASSSVLSTLHSYGARLLGTVDTPQGPCSEPLRFLSYLLNHEDRPVLLPRQDLSTYLPTARVSFGRDAMEIRGATRGSHQVAAVLSIKEYPPETCPGLMDGLLRCPYELVLTQSFAFVSRPQALQALSLVARRMDTAEDAAVSLRAHLEQARDDAASGRVAFGEHHLSVLLKAPSVEQLDDALSEVLSEFTNLGIVAVREDINLEPSYWAQLPGNFSYIARRSLISSANFAGFASLHNFPQGRRQGNHWGRCVTVLETTSGTPYAFNFHHRDLGNWICIGPSGTGKSVLLTFLLAQAQRFQPRSVYFDKDRGAEIAIRAMGGSYRQIRPGTSGLGNPLALPDSPRNRAFLRDFLASLLCPLGSEPLSAAQRELIAEAVAANYDSPPEYRQLCYLQELFRGHERASADSLASRLAPWYGDGEFAWLFDNKEDELAFEERTTGFDLTFLLEAPIMRTPALFYLFHRVDLLLDGTKTLLFIDEAWKALDDPLFEGRLKDWLKTVRKRNGLVGFASQSAQDALRSRISDSIIEQTPTQIFMPNPKADPDAYCRGFGLTPRELELVRTLPDTSRCFLVKHGLHSVIARLDLDGMDDTLAVLSGREETVRLLEGITAEVGDDPQVWLPIFHQRRRTA